MQKKNVSMLLALVLLAGCSSSPPENKPVEQNVQVREQEPKRMESRAMNAAQKSIVPPMPSVAAAPAMQGAASYYGGAYLDPGPKQKPGWNRESYNAVQENGFINVGHDPLSTFSIDVDTASYANVRRFVNEGSLPPVGAVRIEELINYFTYNYPEPLGKEPFALNVEVGPSPYHQEYRLACIGLKAKDLAKEQLPPSNLVFLVDVSGSMQAGNKLPLLQQALPLLIRQFGRRDRVSMVVYAGADSVVLQPTAGNRQQEILAAIDQLRAGGSTHASSGIRTAYQLARQAFIPGGNNRVILASDGDFNVGVTSRDELARLIEQERKDGIYLTVLGFGMGNYHDDTMEVLADKGNGNYAYIDSLLEAKKVLVKEMSGTLFALANDVKIQVEFNPARVGAYRLIGYENRALADEDFKDDSKDAGEVGVGHRVTALYELIPAGHKAIPQLDPLKYQRVKAAATNTNNELMTVKLRYKPQDKTRSQELSLGVSEAEPQGSVDFRFAAAVAGYGMLLTHSQHLGHFTWEDCLRLAREGRGQDSEGYRAEFYRLVEMSELLAKQQKNSDTPQPLPQPILR
ncbi:MAG: VWA domain-containing protein [Desulfobulbus sp.]|nr:VWA domain-containing protein [Desulfobulbus sp.]